MFRDSRWFLLLIVCLFTTHVGAQENQASVKELQEEMYRLFYQSDSTAFYAVIKQLKEECQKTGNEQVFYKAWGNQAIYESSHQRRTHALEIAKEMKAYAESQNSKFGLYTSTHVMGTIYQQMRNYEEAEAAFKEAIEDLHKYFPGESAAADYIELLLVAANGRNDAEAAKEYAQKALNEPNVTYQHQLRALSMLCQIVGEGSNPDREVYNKLYEQRQKVREHTPADKPEQEINILYYLINGQYEKALELTQTGEMAKDMRALLQAKIYHKMGNDTKAYESMVKYKSVRDSANRAERTGLLSEYIEQLSNERLESQRLEQEKQITDLRNRYWFTVIAFVIILLAYIIYRRYKTIGRLEKHNAQLDEARQAEHQAREEAEKALDVKREFLNNISHELRTPLNPITGFSDILATPGFELAADERTAMSQHIKDNSKILTGIIDNMIELSFYESKVSLPKEDTLSPNIICMHITDELRPNCQPNVQMAYISELKDDVNIKTDLQSVEKVLRQLLNNAIKYTTQGSIVLHCSEYDDKIRFTVTDTGPGIAAEQIEHLFEPFSKTNDNVKPTGMGLSICHSIAKLLGGSIRLDEEYTGGSRFVFMIPKA